MQSNLEYGSLLNKIALLEEENNSLRKEIEFLKSDEAPCKKYINKLQDIIEKAPFAYIEIDINRKISQWNSFAEQIFKIPKSVALGSDAANLLSELNEKATLINLLLKFSKSSEPLVGQNTYTLPDGTKLILEWFSIPVFNSDRELVGFAAIVRDLTEKIKYEKELILARQKAEDSDNLKSDFLANMSHEIRTPMNGILGFTELLREKGLNESKRIEYLDRVDSCGRHLLHLINDIIDISKIEAGKINITEKECSLSGLFFELFFFFQAENSRNGKNIELKMVKETEDDKCKVITDITRLRQILTNLIGNALKFTSRGRVVFGYNVKDSDNILFFVKDTGIGIPQEKLTLIFDRFRQADNSTTRKYGGTGLGLAISKGLVELLGGDIWVESTEGKGSEFYFTIPYKRNKPELTRETVKEKAESRIIVKNKTLLVVEDDETSYRYIEEILRKTSLKLIHVTSGKKAVSVCKNTQEIDLVLMDIMVPDLNGLEATKKIKQFRRELPIIAQTANAMDDDQRKCLSAGCDDYISKPLNKKLLIEKINKFLNEKI